MLEMWAEHNDLEIVALGAAADPDPLAWYKVHGFSYGSYLHGALNGVWRVKVRRPNGTLALGWADCGGQLNSGLLWESIRVTWDDDSEQVLPADSRTR